MSLHAAAELDSADCPADELAASRWPLIGLGAASAAGLALFWWQFEAMWSLWTTDSLRSIGILVIPVSIVLAVRSLDRDDFASGGSWWGLALVAIAVASANFIQYLGAPALVFGNVRVDLLPMGLTLYLYASGVVILFGGVRAWRKAGFALFLLLFVQPVPIAFTTLIDWPLQRLGATAVRHFAWMLGVPVNGAALRVMFFHDQLGMFIAPGCNGLQGAAAMGLLALVIGHLRRMRLAAHVTFVAVAIALAYIFNLVRLCALVIFYCAAHWMPLLAGYAVQADYVIGGVLFMTAAAFLFWAPRTGQPE